MSEAKEIPVKLIQYGVWEQDEDYGYWALYDTLADAVNAVGDGVEVYRIRAKYAGKYKRAVKLQRMRSRKKK